MEEELEYLGFIDDLGPILGESWDSSAQIGGFYLV